MRAQKDTISPHQQYHPPHINQLPSSLVLNISTHLYEFSSFMLYRLLEYLQYGKCSRYDTPGFRIIALSQTSFTKCMRHTVPAPSWTTTSATLVCSTNPLSCWDEAGDQDESSRICLSSVMRASAASHASSSSSDPDLPTVPPRPSWRTVAARLFSSSAIVIVVGRRGCSNAVGSGRRHVLHVSCVPRSSSFAKIPHTDCSRTSNGGEQS